MARVVIMLALTVLAASIPARAQRKGKGNDSPCSAAVTTIELNACFAKARELADAQLNAAYEKIRGKLQAPDEERLVTAQRLWMQYREANCIAERELYAGGTAATTMYLSCLEAMARTRAKELMLMYAARLQ